MATTDLLGKAYCPIKFVRIQGGTCFLSLSPAAVSFTLWWLRMNNGAPRFFLPAGESVGLVAAAIYADAQLRAQNAARRPGRKSSVADGYPYKAQ